MTDADEIDRLSSRLERERRARRQAEQIAERGMRELWETNRELQERVARRTEQLERSVAALSLVHRCASAEVSSVIRELLDEGIPESVAARLQWIERAVVVPPAPPRTDPTTAVPLDVGDEILDRWQRQAARSGQLLSVEVGGDPAPRTARWDHIAAVSDVVLAGVVRHGPSGSVTVDLAAGDDAVVVTVCHAGLGADQVAQADDRAGQAAFDRLGDIGATLTLATDLAMLADGRLHAAMGPDGLVVTATIPVAG